MIDPNSTYPIILSPTINATLIPSSDPIKDWLPSIMAVVVVIIGYFLTVRAQRQQRLYDLKKEVYLDVLKAIIEVRRKWEIYNETILDFNTITAEQKRKPIHHEFDEIIDILRLIEMRLQMCASTKVYGVFFEVKLKALDNNRKDFDAIIEEKLIPAMAIDLRNKETLLERFLDDDPHINREKYRRK